MAAILKLKILTGRHSGREIEVRQAKFVIGRAEDCDLRPASHEVSRRHCALLVESDGVKLQDLGGSNGTFVNGARAEGQRKLASGDRIKVGPLEFQAIITTSSPPAAAPQAGSRPAASNTTAPHPAAPHPAAPHPRAPAQPQSTDSAAAQAGAEDDDVMQWLTDAPGQSRPIFLQIEPEGPDAAGTDTGQISLDATHPLSWPESPQTSEPLPESASRSALRNSGNPASKLPEPKDAGNTRDAAAAAIDMFRHRNDKQPPAGG